MRDEESTAEVIRRTLRLLHREAWLARARAYAERMADEDLPGGATAW
jgi:antitoxin ParD1/3/4